MPRLGEHAFREVHPQQGRRLPPRLEHWLGIWPFAVALLVLWQVFRPFSRGSHFYSMIFLGATLPLAFLCYRPRRRKAAEGEPESEAPGTLDWVLVAFALLAGFYPMLPDVVETVKLGNPMYQDSVIPAGTYRWQSDDVPTVEAFALLLVRPDFPVDLACAVTKLIFENVPELVEAHRAAEEITLYTAKEVRPMPLHPGATRAFDLLLSEEGR